MLEVTPRCAGTLDAIAIAINPHFVDKVPRDDLAAQAHFNDTFVNRNLTARGLLEEIRRGHAFAATHRKLRHRRADGNMSRYRCRENFLSAQHLALDFDDRGFADLLAEPFIRDHAAFLYTTASHTPDAPRARAVFVLDRAIEDADAYAGHTAALAHLCWPFTPSTAGSWPSRTWTASRSPWMV